MNQSARLSLLALVFSALVIAYFGGVFYPKWTKPETEATIGWDVSGYYAYLPAAFIYHDMKKASFLDSVMIPKYRSTPNNIQGFTHKSGNYVFKYPIGQALQFMPWFFAANALASPLGYPADGFSLPYQVAISWGSFLVAFLGLWVSRKSLLNYFSDKATALSLLLLTFGTNYLNYSAIDNAMTHNWLFTCYALVIYFSIRYYRSPSYKWAVLIGLFCGWAMITRPTEVIIVLIPLLWGVYNRTTLRGRISALKTYFPQYLAAAVALVAVGFIQLAYWKYAGGEWVIYSYEDQGFTWLHAHIGRVLFSYRAGWLTYSPAMGFALIGMYFLAKKHTELFPTAIFYFLINLYIVSAWAIWWYGGSLGMRALVQSAALLLFPMTAFWEWILQSKGRTLLATALSVFFIWMNLWWTFQAHKPNGAFASEQMTKAFYWKVIGKDTFEHEWLKLLDTNELYEGGSKYAVDTLAVERFEADTDRVSLNPVLKGQKSAFLNKDNQFTKAITCPPCKSDHDWITIACTVKCAPKEWNWWRMTQLICQFKAQDKVVKNAMIRVQRLVDGEEEKQIWLDVKVPREAYDSIKVYLWNADSDKTVYVDDLSIIAYKSAP